MNPLLKKEIRLLLPAWGAALLLVAVAIFIFGHLEQPRDVIGNFTPVWLGLMMLCASSFGREFSLGTFSSLIAQPVAREKFWLVKIGVLAVALVSVVLAYCCLIYSSLPAAIGWREAAWLVVLLLCAIAGGLWLALVVRQMVAVIWLVAIVPGGLCVPFVFVLAHYQAADRTVEATLFVVLLLYAIAGIGASWRMFQHAQDGPPAEGTISMPAWLSIGRLRRTYQDTRHYMPTRALIWKELHFNQVLLAGMAGLFALHLLDVLVRVARLNSPGGLNDLLQGLPIMWVVVPLILGCVNIAEERRLGMMESQLCLPVANRRKFLIKLAFIVVAGGFLTTSLPMLAEWLGHELGLKDNLPNGFELAGMLAAATAIALIGFYASSLTRNVHQAPVLALGLILGIPAVWAWFVHISGYGGSDFLIPGVVLWNPFLVALVLAATLTVTLPWLTYRNFRCLYESARVGRRNTLGLAVAVAFTMVASVLLYHRAWEKLTPFEPAHGPARWTMARRPVALHADLFNNLLMALPDGQFWFGALAAPSPITGDGIARWVARDLWSSGPAPRLEVQQMIAGSNWVSVAPGQLDIWLQPGKSSVAASNPPEEHIINSRETVGIRTDGTLWVSSAPGTTIGNTNPLVQIGTETNWLAVRGERSLTSVLLLKQDGTLWRWGERSNPWWKMPDHWSGLQDSTPRQIGTDTNWQGFVPMFWAAAQKTDGSVWNIRYDAKDRRDDILLNTNFAAAGLTSQRLDTQRLAGNPEDIGAGVHPDGTLWIWGHIYNNWANSYHAKIETHQSGHETNWEAVALGRMMVGLKSDGTLWRWGGRYSANEYPAFLATPSRMGIHEDWVALTSADGGFVTLAADGSLWFWRDDDYYGNGMWPIIEPSEKPIPLGNLFAAD